MSAEQKEPPHSIEAEEATIACCLMDRDTLIQVIGLGLKPEHFYKTAHETMFAAMMQVSADFPDQEITEIELLEALRKSGQVSEVGGISAIYAIQDRVETPVQAKYFAGLVLDKARSRQLIRLCRESIEASLDQSEDVETVGARLEAGAREVGESLESGSTVEAAPEIVDRVVEDIKNRMTNPEEAKARITTPLADLNAVLPRGGFLPGQMVVIAARPSVGKTSLAMNFADHSAVDDNVPVLVFSLEMTADELISRQACSRSRIDSKDLDRAYLCADKQKQLGASLREIKNSNLLVDNDTAITPLKLIAKAKHVDNQLKRKGESLGMIVVDYLQLMRGDNQRLPREQQIADMSRNMKLLAGELKVPVVVLSQLNRGSEKDNREPRISDLRESGSIEQDADIVLLLHRPDQEQFSGGHLPDPSTEVIKIIHGKIRNGPIGDILSTFKKTYTRFCNYTRH